MSLNSKILLARPHAFIVAEMRPFLEKGGFSSTKLDRLEDLQASALGAFSGAIISTAVVSSVQATAEEVFRVLRRHYPRLPVLFAGLAGFDSLKSVIERTVGALHGDAEILPIAAATEGHLGLGRANVFVALRKEDLAAGAAAELTGRIVRKHFR